MWNRGKKESKQLKKLQKIAYVMNKFDIEWEYAFSTDNILQSTLMTKRELITHLDSIKHLGNPANAEAYTYESVLENVEEEKFVSLENEESGKVHRILVALDLIKEYESSQDNDENHNNKYDKRPSCC